GGDDDAAPRSGFDQPFGHEPREGLTDGCSGDPESLGLLDLADGSSRLEVPFDDVGPQGLVCALGGPHELVLPASASSDSCLYVYRSAPRHATSPQYRGRSVVDFPQCVYRVLFCVSQNTTLVKIFPAFGPSGR